MIGFIGLGLMGSRMARNLLESGYELIVHNRTKEKAAPLLEAGAKWANSPKEAAEQADVLFTMLAHPKAVEAAAFGENGFLHHLSPEKLWVDCSTVDPSFTRQMAEEARKRGIHFLDAPVSGSVIPAEKGELVFFVGGDPKDLKKVEPVECHGESDPLSRRKWQRNSHEACRESNARSFNGSFRGGCCA
ncbi:NAD(P)-dependent oxidoreductase [Anoxybacteroides rupiense]|uniref:NAD(P)-dependent oxidoreductase n=1 Tax=Anoxybacteroides rupiense TaxID=311460 RepID=UPI00184A025D|nr:NAD(P)-binding domain-containing protein [Anoxybacillus rupiensis]MBB3907818.1 3-hydroxyisobutyrate dehydrogenase-like beta-hydroxyacid dehydrogenase [Anoxybacillus rupiensis]